MLHVTVGPWDPLSTALQTSVAKREQFPKAGSTFTGKLYVPWSLVYGLVPSSAR